MGYWIEKIVQRSEGNMDYLSFGHSRVHFFHLWWILFFGITIPGVPTHAEYSGKGNCMGYSLNITLTFFDFRVHVETWNFDVCFFSKPLLSIEWPDVSWRSVLPFILFSWMVNSAESSPISGQSSTSKIQYIYCIPKPSSF